MNTMSLSVADGTATFTDDLGRVFTADASTVEPGDAVSMQNAGCGPYLVAERDGVEIAREPLRCGEGGHYEDLRAIMTWTNPILPEEAL